MRPDTLAIPVFLLLVGVEAAYGALRGRRLYRRNDTISSLSTGVLQLGINVFLKLVALVPYTLVLEHRIADFVPTWWTYALTFVALDFCFYWYHRISHERNVLWAVHVVHQQSEELNFAVALRVAVFKSLATWPFYLPLALAGVPVEVFLFVEGVHVICQFPIHTRAIGRLGPLEWIFVTPSHHRVHHAANPEYLDKNYGGVLIVWDRLFGTFEPEVEEPVYGLVSQLDTWNPVRASLEPFAKIVRLSRRCDRLRDAVYAFVAPPAWSPGEPAQRPDVRTRAKLAQSPMRWRVLAVIGLFVAGFSTVVGALLAHSWPLKIVAVGAVWTIFYAMGRLLDAPVRSGPLGAEPP